MKEPKDSLKTITVTQTEVAVGTLLDARLLFEPQIESGLMIKRLRLGLFLGGSSSEKEISLESGRHVYNNLDREKYDVLTIFVDSKHHFWQIPETLLWKNTARDIESSLVLGGAERIYWEDLKNLIDFAFSCLHGKYGEEAILGLFEIINIPNNGASVLGGALSMDKAVQRRLLLADGLNLPKYLTIESEIWNLESEKVSDQIEGKFGYPFMVKPSREGSSTALHKVKSRPEIEAALNDAFKYDNVVLAEEVLEGMELTTLVYGIDDLVQALPPTQLLKSGDFLTAEEKFLPGGAQMITPPPLPEELIRKIQEESVKAYRSLNLKVYSRIDSFLIGPGITSSYRKTYENVSRERFHSDIINNISQYKVVILEPNNPPAMTPSTALWLQAAEAGYHASQFLDIIIQISRQAHSQKLGPL